MKKIIFLLLLTCCADMTAQTSLRVHYKEGTRVDIPLNTIDSLTIVEKATPTEEPTLTGSWLWGSREQGYYELLTFNPDHTYTGYDNYFTYGFDTMTYGWYAQIGTMLTLQSNGFGYQRRYNWFVTGLSANALDVMTRMGRFVYYRLQPATIRLKATDTPLACADGERFVFADGVVVEIADNQLHPIASGTTYILKKEGDSILGYKVEVE